MSPKQGKRGKRAAARPQRSAGRRRLALLVFAVFLIASLVIAAAANGLNDPDPSGEEIVIVEDAPNGTITKAEFDAAMERTAKQQGLKRVPKEDNPQYQSIKDTALADLILARWVAGEAAERGIDVSEREIDEELETVVEQQFGSRKEFNKFLEQSGFSQQEARDRIELQVMSNRIQEQVLPEDPEVTEDEIEDYYVANPAQFEQPETRDVRVITTKKEKEAEEALKRLQKDDSNKSFKDVAREFSIDEATKSTGGLRRGVVQGQSEAALDEQIFSATPNELVGPFKTDSGFSVIEVEKVNEAQTTSLEDAHDQIRQTLVAAKQQEIAQGFQGDFQTKWRSRTFCAKGYITDRCANSEPPPDPCTEEVANDQGCDAPVASTRPIAPGTATVFGTPPTPGLPQGPVRPASEQAPAGLPPGISPVGPGGAPPPGSTAPPPGG